jgi:prepilin-type N-terminal cleavage/methylation domain-containing protein
VFEVIVVMKQIINFNNPSFPGSWEPRIIRLDLPIRGNDNGRVNKRNKNKGFTLLEMVLVLFILAIITATSLSFIESEDGQIRYNESIQKRDAIIDVIYSETIEGNQRILSGYVVDNGRLPDFSGTVTADVRMEHLLRNIDSWLTFSNQTIRIHTGGTEGDVSPALTLFKGFSNSNYLRVDNDTGTDEYKDGWGQQFYLSDPASNQITIGYDGDGSLTGHNPDASITTQLVKPVPYNIDNDTIVRQEDWTVDIGQLNILVDNNTCTGEGPPCDYEIAITVFSNQATCSVTTDTCWDTYHFSTGTLNNGDTYDTSVTPTSWSINGGALGSGDGARIPAGEHMAFVLVDPAVTTYLASVKFKVFPNSTQPTVTLTVP